MDRRPPAQTSGRVLPTEDRGAAAPVIRAAASKGKWGIKVIGPLGPTPADTGCRRNLFRDGPPVEKRDGPEPCSGPQVPAEGTRCPGAATRCGPFTKDPYRPRPDPPRPCVGRLYMQQTSVANSNRPVYSVGHGRDEARTDVLYRGLAPTEEAGVDWRSGPLFRPPFSKLLWSSARSTGRCADDRRGRHLSRGTRRRVWLSMWLANA
jgi:hypothetical protein